MPANRVFAQGPPGGREWSFSDDLDTYGFAEVVPGRQICVSSEEEDRTYSALVAKDGSLTDVKPFAERGGENVAVDGRGNVFVANGQIFVYNPAGKTIDEIDVPERPIDLVFGGAGHDTLFILAHHALFAVKVQSTE